MSSSRTSLRAALEAALVENPDDLATHMAYADHLVEQGDPRGEFIQVQLALEDDRRPEVERERLRQREEELFAAHRDEWLGDAAPHLPRSQEPAEADLLLLSQGNPQTPEEWRAQHDRMYDNRYRFRRGWLDTLYVGRYSGDLLEALGRCPTIALLWQLTLAGQAGDDPEVHVLAESSYLGNLRRFQLGVRPDQNQCYLSGDGISAAIAGMNRLEELYLYAHRVEMGEVFALPLSALRTLYACHMYEFPLEALAANPHMGNLITLSCWPHGLEPDDGQAYIRPDAFQALVRSPHLKSLTHLALYLSDIGDQEMAALVQSGLLRQLRVLDLWNGRVSDEGARILAGCPDLRRLQRLRLAQNQLTGAGIALLQATGVNLEAGRQFTPGQIEGNEHLFEGDCE
jgi:uncharacterized protein (TIGR02996 family)